MKRTIMVYCLHMEVDEDRRTELFGSEVERWNRSKELMEERGSEAVRKMLAEAKDEEALWDAWEQFREDQSYEFNSYDTDESVLTVDIQSTGGPL